MSSTLTAVEADFAVDAPDARVTPAFRPGDTFTPDTVWWRAYKHTDGLVLTNAVVFGLTDAGMQTNTTLYEDLPDWFPPAPEWFVAAVVQMGGSWDDAPKHQAEVSA